MTSVWKTKVLTGLNKLFDKDGKKAASAEFLKSFNKVATNSYTETLESCKYSLCLFSQFFLLIGCHMYLCRRRLARRLMTRRQS